MFSDSRVGSATGTLIPPVCESFAFPHGCSIVYDVECDEVKKSNEIIIAAARVEEKRETQNVNFLILYFRGRKA